MHAVFRLGLWKLYNVVVYTALSHPTDLPIGVVGVTEFATAENRLSLLPDKQVNKVATRQTNVSNTDLQHLHG